MGMAALKVAFEHILNQNYINNKSSLIKRRLINQFVAVSTVNTFVIVVNILLY